MSVLTNNILALDFNCYTNINNYSENFDWLEKIWDKTVIFLNNKTKEERKKYGQFLTNIKTARFMASLFSIVSSRRTTRFSHQS